ncbi:MAG TPA: MBL fold metallo-hydrolase [Methylomirabilota bacterium]|nr:MBL fold metallo-hydrolase [Methylomirabilota bacterium]
MQSGTTVHEIADSVYRIATPVRFPGGAEFSFNQYLVVDEMPLLFHTGLRRLFPLVREAVGRVLAVERLRYLGFSHFEADECGSLNEWLAVAPGAVPLCGRIAAGTSINDVADRAPRVLGDAETLALGRSTVRWLDTPHVPHAWECGMLYEERTRTLLCSDLFTQGGLEHAPLTEGDILGPSEAMRARMDYFAHSVSSRQILERLATLEPRTLACMHGSAWRGDGAGLLRALGDILDQERSAVR